MIILAIDSGIEKTGYCFFEKNKKFDQGYRYIFSGLIKTSKKKSTADRIREIYEKIDLLIEKYHPNAIVLEQLFFFKNQKTAVKVSQAQGALLLLASQKNIELTFLPPLEIKQVVTGYGLSDKKSVQKMLTLLLKEKIVIADDDQSDAIACGMAYCLLNRNNLE